MRAAWILFALIYLLSPIDLVPEIALGPVGLLDDLAVLITAAKQITQGKKN